MTDKKDDKTSDDNVTEIDGRKYLKWGDKHVPIIDSVEDLYQYIESDKNKEVH